MSSIYVYSPAGAVRDKAGFRRGTRFLERLGHKVTVDADALSSHQRFAGDDATRLQAISRAASSQAGLALISRGGYGLTRLLPHIDYQAIANSISGGTQWMGFSDFTALQSALYAKTKATTYAGAALIADFGLHPTTDRAVDDITQACFDDVLAGIDEGAGWTLPKADRERYANLSLSGTKAKPAVLWGGNLTVLTSLIGTPYLPKIEGGVLWFEDTGDAPYKIERNLTQWLNAGLLHQQRAIVFGQFTNYKLYPHDKGFKLQSVVDWLRERLDIPVLTGLPFGHVSTKVMLPFGAAVKLFVDGRDAMIYWGD